MRGIRPKIFAIVSALILLCLVGSVINLIRITAVYQTLQFVTDVTVPLGKVIAQIEFDAELLRREIDQRLGRSHWGDLKWKARPISNWMENRIQSNFEQLRELLKHTDWGIQTQSVEQFEAEFKTLKIREKNLVQDLNDRHQFDLIKIEENYVRWVDQVEQWRRKVRWGGYEIEQNLKLRLKKTQKQVSDLRLGLEILLGVVVFLSLSLMWIGEKALRPLRQLTLLAREIAERGLKKSDKVVLSDFKITDQDEVSTLAHEFKKMATVLLEREKTVEHQKTTLEEQNRQLREMSRLESRLRSAEQLAGLGRLSAQVAHEIRNPLHAIGLEAEIAFEEASRCGQVMLKESLRSILASVEKLESITDNYLKFSKTNPREKNKFDFGLAFESALSQYSDLFQAKKIKVEWTRVISTPLWMLGDQKIIEQAIGNLLKNSIQALSEISDRERIIRIDLSQKGQKISFIIEDSGHGIPEPIRDQIFTPFFTTKAEGTGLGLSFVKQVIENHQGSLNLISTSHLSGACFEIELPLESIQILEEKINHAASFIS